MSRPLAPASSPPPPPPPRRSPPGRVISYEGGVPSYAAPSPPPRPAPGKVIAYEAGVPSYAAPSPRRAGPGKVISVEGGVPSYAAPTKSAAYRRAVLAVFAKQPGPVGIAILRRAIAHPTPVGKILLDAQRKGELKLGPALTGAQKKALIGNVPLDPLNLGGLVDQIVGGVSQFRSATTLAPNDIGQLQTTPAASQYAANALKDAVDLPATTLTSLALIGGDVAQGKLGRAAKDIYGPFLQAAEHPEQALAQHPLDTALMFTGLAHGATRLAAAPLRALAPEGSRVGRALSTSREGVALTGNLTHERPAFSKSPTVKASQASVDRALYKRTPTGELIPRTPFLRDRQMSHGVAQLAGVAERIRRANREAVIVAREKAVRPSVASRVGHAAKTALAYGPSRALIPGAAVLARIADGTIRRPDTIIEDLHKHLQQVAATRPELLGDPQALKAHDAYVKELQAALKNRRFLKDPIPAFKAADAYARDYAPVERRAHLLGHFGEIPAIGLERRALAHIVQAHWPGARFDEGLQTLVHDAPVPAIATELTRLRRREEQAAALLRRPGTEGERAAAKAGLARIQTRIRELVPRSQETLPITTEQMRAFAARETGGRQLAYTPDRVSFDRGNGAFYVSSERRPLPNTQRNTLYAYTHGLTRPGHEALTEQHALLQGVVDSHHAQNRYLDTLATQKPGGGYWDTYAAAKRDAPAGYVPINVSQPFHPQASLDQALQDANPASIEEEAVRRSLDLRDRLQPGTRGRWAIIDQRALKALRAHENQIQPNTLLRTIRGLNNQFRTVALSTSAKHIPGVIQENLIRDVANGVGFRSWVTGRRILRTAGQMRPEQARELRVQLTGGQVAGMTEAGKTYTVSDHWAGTSAYGLLRAMEASFKAPGLRQIRTAWRAWTHFAIRGTKRLLEEQHQIAGLGKAALREHGYADAAKTDGFLGLAQRAFALHGRMLEDAAKGLFDQRKARQMRAEIQRMYGHWTDLSPSAQTALMFSPFGLWWANSARFLARMPVDMPVKTSLLAAANVGTQRQRQKLGLDMFAPGALPLYEQGGIPLPGGRVLAQNYYSPFGIANDPLATGQSLIQPWLTSLIQGAGGVDYLWRPLSSPNNPRGYKQSNVALRAQYILDSALASFIPLYTKASQVTEEGASPYDVTDKGFLPPLLRGQAPPTKQAKQGLGAGLAKAFNPVREYRGSAGGSSSGTGAGGLKSGTGNLGSAGSLSGGVGTLK